METNNVIKWLEDIGLSDYKNNFIAEGYDDLVFIMNFNEEQLDELVDDVGMTKKGHVMKLKVELQKLKASRVEKKIVQQAPLAKTGTSQ